MIVYATADFRRQIEELAKKNNYSEVLSDICSFFLDRDVNELHGMRDIIQNVAGTYSLNKWRIGNSNMQRGKRGSYRCVCACFLAKDTLVLGRIYAKTGSDGIDNLPKEEYKSIAKTIQVALEKKDLFVLSLVDGTFKSL